MLSHCSSVAARGYCAVALAGALCLATVSAADVAPRQVALAFLVRRPAVFTIPKAGNPAHAADNARAGNVLLTAREIEEMKQRLLVEFPRAQILDHDRTGRKRARHERRRKRARGQKPRPRMGSPDSGKVALAGALGADHDQRMAAPVGPALDLRQRRRIAGTTEEVFAREALRMVESEHELPRDWRCEHPHQPDSSP